MDKARTQYLNPVGDITPLITMGTALQAIATEHGIHNVFDDNGSKELLMVTLFGLTKLRREGDDAIDSQARRYEMKTVARISSDGVRKSTLSVTTEHTMMRDCPRSTATAVATVRAGRKRARPCRAARWACSRSDPAQGP